MRVTHTGFLTDILCWELVDAVDGARMPTNPEAHTVHCMRDLQECVDSGFGVLDREEGAEEYYLKYIFDKAGNAQVMEVLKATDKRANFRVTVSGQADGIYLKEARVSEPSAGAVPENLAGDLERQPEAVLWAHALLMLFAFAWLLPWGFTLAYSTRGVGAPGAWFTAHLRLQTYGWVLQLLGLVAGVVYTQTYTAHLRRVHPVLGTIVVSFCTLQPLNAVIRPHPDPKTRLRHVWEYWHKWGGRAVLVLAIVTAVLGIQLAHALAYESTLIVVSSILLGLGLVPCVAFLVLGKHPATRTAALILFRMIGAKGTTDMRIEDVAFPKDDDDATAEPKPVGADAVNGQEATAKQA